MGRYRLRTRIRGRLPVALQWLSPKGERDCGDHEWHRADAATWRCYHCEVGVTERSPWSPADHAIYSAAALEESLRLDTLRIPDPEAVSEELRLVRELDDYLRTRAEPVAR
jgi:hypothetical protein